MTASRVCRSYLKTMAVAEWGLPVLRPAWTSSKNVWPRSPPHPRRYSDSGSRKTARARRPGFRRSPSSGFAARPAGCDAVELPNVITSEPARTHGWFLRLANIGADIQPEAKVLLGPDPPHTERRPVTNPDLRRRHRREMRQEGPGRPQGPPSAPPDRCAATPACDDNARPSQARRLQRHRRPRPRVATPFNRSQGLRTHRTDRFERSLRSKHSEGDQRIVGREYVGRGRSGHLYHQGYSADRTKLRARGRSPAPGGPALPEVGWRVPVLVRDRCRLLGLPGLAAVAGRLRLPAVRAWRRMGRR